MRPHQTITLKHLHIKGEKQIGLKFQPNKMIQTIIKGLPNVAWSKQFGMAAISASSLPFTPAAAL